VDVDCFTGPERTWYPSYVALMFTRGSAQYSALVFLTCPKFLTGTENSKGNTKTVM
jgi:hypothetical protein